MPLVDTRRLLEPAAAARRGVAAFNVITLEYAEAVVTGAETAGRPVVLQLSENAVAFHLGRLRPLTAALRELADAATVDVSLHLDHVEDEELLRQSADAGFSSVMFDAGRLTYADNLSVTTEAACWAHERGLLVEAELGYVGGKDTQVSSAHAPGTRTDPDQAAAFVAATGVDALAVAVGSSHAMTSRDAALDLELVARLRGAVGVPLVLHGSSGVPGPDLARAIAAGITKVNVGTLLSVAYTGSLRASLAASPEAADPRRPLAAAREAVSAVVVDLLQTVDPGP